MNTLMRWLAPVLFKISYWIFRSPVFKGSKYRHDKLMKIFRFCADNDSVQALSVYGHLLHFRGEGKDNRIQGGIYLNRAADKGDVKAQYQMGKIYEEGFEHYFEPSNEKAMKYFSLAAEQGHHLAVSRLIKAYQEGELGIQVDQKEAALWQARLPQLPE